MARADYELDSVPSLLDRLLDDEPGLSKEPKDRRVHNYRKLEQSVARDLEALLNSRQESLEALPEGFEELNESLLFYGLPDLTSLSLVSEDDRRHARDVLERAIKIFEPRLDRVQVTLEPPREHDRTLRFRIDALLRLDPAVEPVSFDAVLQLNNHQYVVQSSG